jgi:hypothetical protein
MAGLRIEEQGRNRRLGARRRLGMNRVSLAGIGSAALRLLGMLPCPAWAQPPATSFDQLPGRIRVGDDVWVTGDDGVEVKGKLWDLSPAALKVHAKSATTEFKAGSVRSVSTRDRDSLANGAWIGFAAGVGFAALVSSGCGDEYLTCLLFGGLFYGGAGAGIGVAIDAMVPGQKVEILRTAPIRSSTHISVAPIVSPRQQGVVLRVAF